MHVSHRHLPRLDAVAASQVLSPVDRLAEVLFGLIMVMSFTGSIAVATAGREEIREMLIAAIGCNLAWAIVDAVMFGMNALLDRGRGLLVIHQVRQAATPAQSHEVITEALPPVVAHSLGGDGVELLRTRLLALDELPARARPTWGDLKGSFGVFLLVFLSTFPVVLPFIFLSDAPAALRLSNGIAMFMLLLGGALLGRYAGFRPLVTGLVMVGIGIGLVAITIALGG
ncbi:MAG TPA: hypothetical protein VJN95_02195 [Gemmatimonadales bacterium]|nr:hypothetical protein [Gemmatimonadales bacterium]